MTGITGVFTPVIDNVGKILDFLNPFSDNFILKRLWNFLTDIVSYINPFSDNFFGKKLVDLIGNLFKTLFIPSENYFTDKFSNLKESFTNRLSYQSYIDVLEQTNLIVAHEQISIDIDNYKVGTNNISVSKFIDFSVFDKYKSTYYRFYSWFYFYIFSFICYK